jgi:cobalt-zinc-cadmium efflux system outer membrane protein
LDLTEKLSEVQWLPLRSGGAAEEEDKLAAELVEGRPDVMAAQAGFRVTEANWRLARAAMIPDVQAGPIYQTADDGTKYLGFRLQMDIPVWNTGAPLARQRQAEMNQQHLTCEQLKIRAALEAQTAINQYERVLHLVRKAAPVHGDQSSPELKEILSLFEAGQADILAVLTTQGALLQDRRVYLDLLNQMGLSAAAVIQATGLSPERVIHLTKCVNAVNDGPRPFNLPQP